MHLDDPNVVAPARPTAVRWLVFVLACASSWLLYLHRYAWGVVKPFFKQQNPSFTSTQLGWLDSAFMLTYALGQVPAGLVSDWLGARMILPAIMILWSLALATLGAVQGFGPVYIALALFGLAQAGAYPTISKVTRNWFPLQYRTTVQGIVTSMGRVGAGCSSIIVATILLGMMGMRWETALAVIAVPGTLLAAALWLVLRNSPEEHPWTNQAERDLFHVAPPKSKAVAAGEPVRSIALPDQPEADRSWRINTSLPTTLTFGTLLLYAFLSTFADMLYVFWIPTFLRDGKGLDAAQMGLFAPLPLIGGAIGGMLGGALNDIMIRKTGNRRWGRSMVALTGKALAGVMIAASVSIPDGRVVMVLLFACKFFNDWSLPTQWGTITDISGRSAATVFAMVNTLGALGGFVASPVMGRIKDSYGWEGLFYFIAGVYGSAALCWLVIDCTRNLIISDND